MQAIPSIKRRASFLSVLGVAAAFILSGPGVGAAATGPSPDIDYDLPNYAISPVPAIQPDGSVRGGLRKFIDGLPGLTAARTNGLGQYLPVAVADTKSFPGSDYYEIALVDYRERMHSDLPAQGTLLRGYVQLETSENRGWSRHIELRNPDGSGILLPDGNQAYAFDKPHHLGPVIVATQGIPTRIRFCNLLPAGSKGDLFLPVDTTVMGAGEGGWALAQNPTNGVWGQNWFGGSMYGQNRATLHLHGGSSPWISDGTPHQWTTPVGDSSTPLVKGVSSQDVPDMPATEQGVMTFFYPNLQSGRLMFYHDHSYGITRLNVYAGESAGYLLVDPVERALTDGSTPGVPNLPVGLREIAWVIEDKTFVWGSPANAASGVAGAGTYAVDPTWADVVPNSRPGDLWFPHVYMPAQDSVNGDNPMGRWDYQPYVESGVSLPPIPGRTSIVPESFMDTMTVNGTAYPTMNAEPGVYRLRILDGCNDRFVNLSLWLAEPVTVAVTRGGSGYSVELPPAVTLKDSSGGIIPGLIATATVDPATRSVRSVTVTGEPAAVFDPPVSVVIAAPRDGLPAVAVASAYTEVRHVPFNEAQDRITKFPSHGYPTVLDDRAGGVPNPGDAGPAFVQIGTEGGLLPSPVVIENQPIDYEYDGAASMNVRSHALLLGPAERADVLVDFAPFAGRTLILYSDSPAPVPSPDSRYDFYTGDPDQTALGGAPTTLPGYGPNTRTIMQIKVAGLPSRTSPVTDFVNDEILAALRSALPAAFKVSQEPMIVPQSTYAAASGGHVAKDSYASIDADSLTFTTLVDADFGAGIVAAGSEVTVPLKPKSIQEAWDPYGRLNSLLGTEAPARSNNPASAVAVVTLGYTDPTTETVSDGQTQIWKLTHNGVDTHAIHFHLVNAQVINRVRWGDGSIRPPEENELGWKDTVRMNPMEDIIVAVRAKVPEVPFKVPTSRRIMDVTRPLGDTMGFSKVDPGTGAALASAVSNEIVDFGWEYVWHCHLLGHEESDMMRPLVVPVSNSSNWKDRVPPVVSASPLALPPSGWFHGPVIVTLTAIDNRSGRGVSRIETTLDGKTEVASFDPAVEFPRSVSTEVGVSAEGLHTLGFSASDAGGVTSGFGEVQVKIDTTAPVITPGPVTLLPASGAVGIDGLTWYRSASMMYTVSDSGSGLDLQTFPAGEAFAQEGLDHGVTITAGDVAGNSSVFTSARFNIDATAPTITPAPVHLIPPAGVLAASGARWYRSATLDYSASDAGSGLARMSAPSGTVIFPEGAARTVSATAVDRVGNIGTYTTKPYNIDATAPTIAVFTKAVTYSVLNAGRDLATAVAVGAIVATDGQGSGLGDAALLTVQCVSGSTTLTQTIPNGSVPALFVLPDPPELGQAYTLTVTIEDLAGNVGIRQVQGQF